MRKRSRYKPKPILQDPVGYVIAGLQPVSAAKGELTTVGIKNHGALEAVRTGQATRVDIIHLTNAINLARALAHMGHGEDWLPELDAAKQAIISASKRAKFLFTGTELQAVNLAMRIHDAQLESKEVTVQTLECAMDGLAALKRRGAYELVELKETA